MKGRFHFGFLLLALAAHWAVFPPGAQGQEDFFQRGNQLYQEGDFSGALASYQTILQSGIESPDLFYNLGNAYFKTGDLGRSILNYEKALRLRPRDPDTRANLELARSITADEIEPLPRFWVLSAVAWWVEFFPRRGLALTVALAYLLGTVGLCVRILSQGPGPRRIGAWVAVGGGLGLLLFGTTLLAREGALGGADWGIILVEEVAVQSAPSEEDDLTLFHVHEGTKVRLDKATDLWSEIVLEDGRVGWIPSSVFEAI
ncbi:MAG: tetratricopeptide repeat protein [Longimicrobiales bacterium]|nr:tetratricopeptide repeat protein [Longimicrobiales bacterium]